MDLQLVYELSAAQVTQVCELFDHEWWSQGRARGEVDRTLRNSEIVALLDGEQVAAFARVVTDYVLKALVLDVIVAPPYRSEGLGRRLMDAVVEHPELSQVRHFELYCLPALVPFYEQWGFTADLGDVQFMRRTRR